jgi:hypothetical protein
MDLFWSHSGEVACRFHAPSRQDPRWLSEKWEPLSADSARLTLRCERCQTAWPVAGQGQRPQGSGHRPQKSSN